MAKKPTSKSYNYDVIFTSSGSDDTASAIYRVNEALIALIDTGDNIHHLLVSLNSLNEVTSFKNVASAADKLTKLATAIKNIENPTALTKTVTQLGKLDSLNQKSFNVKVKYEETTKTLDAKALELKQAEEQKKAESQKKKQGGDFFKNLTKLGLSYVVLKKLTKSIIELSKMLEGYGRASLINGGVYNSSFGIAGSTGMSGSLSSVYMQKSRELFNLQLFGDFDKKKLIAMSILGTTFSSSIQEIFSKATKFNTKNAYFLLEKIYGADLANAYIRRQNALMTANKQQKKNITLLDNLTLNTKGTAAMSRFLINISSTWTILTAIFMKIAPSVLDPISDFIGRVNISLYNFYNNLTDSDIERISSAILKILAFSSVIVVLVSTMGTISAFFRGVVTFLSIIVPFLEVMGEIIGGFLLVAGVGEILALAAAIGMLFIALSTFDMKRAFTEGWSYIKKWYTDEFVPEFWKVIKDGFLWILKNVFGFTDKNIVGGDGSKPNPNATNLPEFLQKKYDYLNSRFPWLRPIGYVDPADVNPHSGDDQQTKSLYEPANLSTQIPSSTYINNTYNIMTSSNNASLQLLRGLRAS